MTTNRRPTRKTAQESTSGKKTKWVLAALLVLLLSAVGWAVWTPGEDPGIAKIRELRAQMENTPREERRELFGQMREEFEKLSPEVRQSMMAERMKEGQARERKWMGDFFSKTYAEQIAALDKQIDESERRRARRGERGQGQGQGGPPGGRQGFAGGGGGPGGGGGDGGRGGPRGFGGDRSMDPNQRRKQFLDNTTPLDRAQMSAYRQMRDARRAQRGLGG